MIKQISWNTGSGNITLTYQGQGDGVITVQSDTNNLGRARSQVITVETVGGAITRNLTISQAACPFPVGDVRNFSYTGSYQGVELPAGQYKLQCWGAQGGSNDAAPSYGITAQAGGKGGYSEGVITLTQKTTVRIYVGGQGSSSAGGFNGGGSTTGASYFDSGNEFGASRMAGGGGASDVRLSDGELLSRMIVAGGGSGGAMSYQRVATQTTTWSQVASGNSGDVAVYGRAYYRSYVVYLSDVGLAVGDTVRVKYTVSKSCHADTEVYCYPQKTGAGNTGQYRLSPGVYQEFTIPANTAKISINSTVQVYQTTVSSSSISVISDRVINQSTGQYISASGYSCSFYNVSSFRNSEIEVSCNLDSIIVAFVKSQPSVNSMVSFASGWSAVGTYGNGQTFIVPSDASYLYILRVTPNYTWSPTLTISKYPHEISCVIEKGTATTTYTENRDSQVGYVGGGVNGGGYSSAYYGKQNAAGSGGAFGQGAGHSVSNYRYCGAGGGGGWYGGGTAYSDSGILYCRISGGGSGFVNTAASAGNRPSGYTGLELDSGETKAGNTSFPAPGGGYETGHSGNGYVRITRL